MMWGQSPRASASSSGGLAVPQSEARGWRPVEGLQEEAAPKKVQGSMRSRPEQGAGRAEGAPCLRQCWLRAGPRLAQELQRLGTTGIEDREEGAAGQGWRKDPSHPRGCPELVEDSQEGGSVTLDFWLETARSKLTLYAQRQRKNLSYEGAEKDRRKLG